MESDSDGSNEGERENLDLEESASEGEGFEEEEWEYQQDGEGNYIYDPYTCYMKLMLYLRKDDKERLVVWDRLVLSMILENVDEFCQVLSACRGVTSIELGDTQGNDVEGPKLEINNDNAADWNQILRTFESMSSVNKVLVGGRNLSGSLMARILESLPQVSKIDVYLPWSRSADEDLRPLAEALLLHPCQNIDALCFGEFGDVEEGEEHGSSPGNRFLGDNGVVSDLCRLESVKHLWIHGIKLSLDECQSFGGILASEVCSVDRLSLSECSFLDGGERKIFESLSSNTSLKELWFAHMFHENNSGSNKSFCDELVSSLASMCSMPTVLFDGHRSGLEHLDVKQLLMNVAQGNKSITNLDFYGNGSFNLSAEETKEIWESLRNNYSLESITFNHRARFRAITHLNKAGRRYLSEDPHSNSKCIAVLAKVKDKLDCLYYHMRENPILCISYSKSLGALAGKKRKAVDSEL